MKPSHAVIDLARDEDREGILALNRLEYGPNDVLVNQIDFAWRYNQNPAGRAIVPVIRDQHHEVVGFIWIVPLWVRVKGQVILAATGTNLVIHPNYRHTFTYTRLIRRFEQAFRENSIPFHFSFVSEATYQQLSKQTPQTLSTIPLLIKPLDFTALAQTYFTTKWQRFAVDLMKRAGDSRFLQQHEPLSYPEITIEVLTQFDQRFNQFWLSVQDKYSVMVVRNQAFLAWRFAQISGREYCILAACRGAELLGYAVLRCATIRQIKTGLIMDLLLLQGPLGKIAGEFLLAQAEVYFREQGMALALGLMPSFTTEYPILRRAGYVRLPQTLSPRIFRFAFFSHAESVEYLRTLSAQDWFVTIADYESL